MSLITACAIFCRLQKFHVVCTCTFFLCFLTNRKLRLRQLRPYSKSSLTLTLTLTLNESWRFNLSFYWVSMLFLNSWRVSDVPYYVTTHPPAIQKQHWHSIEARIEPIECECEWAFRIRALPWLIYSLKILFTQPNSLHRNILWHLPGERRRQTIFENTLRQF
jgi:hypothetical protein